MADGKSLEIICSECKIGKFICDILNEYKRINDFDKTQTAKLLKQVQELKERDTAKRPIKTKGLKNFHGNIYKVVGECSNCGCGVNSFMMFCDYCGQRLKWEA